MLIAVNTLFEINDAVYYIYKDTVSNDYYCYDYKWFVSSNDCIMCEPTPYKIKQIGVVQSDKTRIIEYLVENRWFKNEDIFKTAEDAQKVCDCRNKNL